MADEPPTLASQRLRWFQNHPVFSLLLVVGGIVIGIGSLTDAVDKIWKFGQELAVSAPTPASTDKVVRAAPMVVFREDFERTIALIDFEDGEGELVRDPKNPKNHVLRFKSSGPHGFSFPLKIPPQEGRYRIRIKILIPKADPVDKDEWYVQIRFYDAQYNSIIKQVGAEYSPDWHNVETSLEVPDDEKYLDHMMIETTREYPLVYYDDIEIVRY